MEKWESLSLPFLEQGYSKDGWEEGTSFHFPFTDSYQEKWKIMLSRQDGGWLVACLPYGSIVSFCSHSAFLVQESMIVSFSFLEPVENDKQVFI